MNNIGADQTAQMCRLVCAFVFGNPEDRFSRVKAHILWTQAIFFPTSLKNKNDLKATILFYSSLLGDNLSGQKNVLKWKMQ